MTLENKIKKLLNESVIVPEGDFAEMFAVAKNHGFKLTAEPTLETAVGIFEKDSVSIQIAANDDGRIMPNSTFYKIILSGKQIEGMTPESLESDIVNIVETKVISESAHVCTEQCKYGLHCEKLDDKLTMYTHQKHPGHQILCDGTDFIHYHNGEEVGYAPSSTLIEFLKNFR